MAGPVGSRSRPSNRTRSHARVSAKTIIKIPFPQGKALNAEEYLFGRQIPNFFFHVITAYAILRHNGVELGKKDYIGQVPGA